MNMEIDLGPLVVISRRNPKMGGGSPASSFGTGFCINENGVIVTAWHTIEEFSRNWSLIDVDEALRKGTTSPVPYESHERPNVMFMRPLASPDELQLFPILQLTGNIDEDVVVGELGGRGRFRPLPSYQLDFDRPRIGEMLSYVGISHPSRNPVDPYGMPMGFAVSHQTAHVLAVDDNSIYLDCDFEYGNSGCPIFSQTTAKVLGIALEVLPPPLAKEKIGIERSVSRAARIHLIQHFTNELRQRARHRIEKGGVSWCSVPSLRP